MISPSARLLLRSLLKLFFRENGGLILFLLFILFAAVGHNNGVGLRAYHYSLITGMLTKPDMFLLVVAAWTLYALRGVSFVLRSRRQPEFSFLSGYALLGKGRLYRQLLLLQLIIFSPVLSYAAIILTISVRLHLYLRTMEITGVLALLSFGVAGGYALLFSEPGLGSGRSAAKRWIARNRTGYWLFLLRYLTTSKKVLFLFVKFFSVTMLWAVMVPMSPVYTDLRMPVLLFSFGPLGHSLFIFQCRDMEEKRLAFYRGLPVTLSRRFAGYAVFYALVFLPETLLLLLTTPAHLTMAGSLQLFGLGYGLLLLLNSILFTGHFSKAGFIKICCGIYLFIFIGVLSGILPLIVLAVLSLAVVIFFRSYYRFELSEA